MSTANRNWRHKIRFCKEPIGNLVAEEGLARALGEYHRQEFPDYITERMEFEKALQREAQERAMRNDKVIVRRRCAR